MSAQLPADDLTPGAALEALLAGNRRWVESRQHQVHQSAGRREALVGGQNPIATVFTCIDSRVAPEIVFDCAIGDLAVVRTGAHVLDQGVVLGSVEFGPQVLHTRLILVVGHESCGAIAAAAEAIDHDLPVAGEIQAIVDALRPAYDAAHPAAANGQELVDLMLREHTRLTARAIAARPTLAPLIAEEGLAVRGAHYALGTGAVTLLD